MSTTPEGNRRLTLPQAVLLHPPLPVIPEIKTVWDIVTHPAHMHPDHRALGWRDTLQTIGKYLELSDYKWMSYKDITSASSEISQGLIQFGISTGDCFNLYAPTSANWQLIYLGCTSVSITITTSEADIRDPDEIHHVEDLTHSLNEPMCVGVFTNARLLPTLLRALPKASTIKLVVYDGEPKPNLVEDLAAIRGTIKLMSVDDLRKFGRAGPSVDLNARLPKQDDVAMIVYTRGSGRKGLILTHASLVASVRAVCSLVGQRWTGEDNYLSSLPQAHVTTAFIFELFFLFIGVPIGYGRTETLADSSVSNCKGDISALSPSVMVADPDFWEILEIAITNKMGARGWFREILFRGSVWTQKIPILTQLGDLFVFYALREAIGGCLRTAVSVGGHISPRTREFLSTILVTIIDGYCDEYNATSTILPPKLLQYTVGLLPVSSIEIKLVDVQDWTNGLPQEGEVCIRGQIHSGYYKNPDETLFTQDGWLRTGYIGRWKTNGTLFQMKWLRLIKLGSDEYLANTKIGAIYEKCPLVRSFCLFRKRGTDQLIAFVIPHESAIRKYLAKRFCYSNHHLNDLCEDPVIREVIKNECNLIGRQKRLTPPDPLPAVILTPVDPRMVKDLHNDLATAHKMQITLASGPALGNFQHSLKSSNLIENTRLDTKLKPEHLAIVVPHWQGLHETLKLKAGLDKSGLERRCEERDIQDLIKNKCNSIGEKKGLKPFELLRAVTLTHQKWSSTNEHVTADRYIKRHEIRAAFKAQIDELQRPALERLEAVFKTCNLVDEIFVYGSCKPQSTLVVIPRLQGVKDYINENAALPLLQDLKKRLDENMNPNLELEILCQEPAILRIIENECNLFAEKNGLTPSSVFQEVILTHAKWTAEDGPLNAQEVQYDMEESERQIDSVYSSPHIEEVPRSLPQSATL